MSWRLSPQHTEPAARCLIPVLPRQGKAEPQNHMSRWQGPAGLSGVQDGSLSSHPCLELRPGQEQSGPGPADLADRTLWGKGRPWRP